MSEDTQSGLAGAPSNTEMIDHLGFMPVPTSRPDVFALVDKEDYDDVARYKWSASPGGYVVRSVPKKERYRLQVGYTAIGMHRQIMKPPDGMVVDHINRLKWDNRRSNFRVCSPAENQAFAHEGLTHIQIDRVLGDRFREFARMLGKPTHELLKEILEDAIPDLEERMKCITRR